MSLSKGQVAAIFSAAATIATAFGLPELAGFAANPFVLTMGTAIVGVIGSFVAGHLPGAKK